MDVVGTGGDRMFAEGVGRGQLAMPSICNFISLSPRQHSHSNTSWIGGNT